MAIPDMINGSLETISAIASLNNCRVLYKQKQVRGVSILSTFFFFMWGCWNLWYYPSLGQTASFVGSLFILTANCLYVFLLIWYVLKEKDVYKLKW